jgi:hypothetical protein
MHYAPEHWRLEVFLGLSIDGRPAGGLSVVLDGYVGKQTSLAVDTFDGVRLLIGCVVVEPGPAGLRYLQIVGESELGRGMHGSTRCLAVRGPLCWLLRRLAYVPLVRLLDCTRTRIVVTLHYIIVRYS